MSAITIQRGHVARRTGATGTAREQEFAIAVGGRLAVALRERGHKVALIGADDPVPAGEVFVALHTDGSNDPRRRGASVGYPAGPNEGRLARAWKAAHQLHGFPGGFLPDNYTPALRGYYGFGRAQGYAHEFLAEHGTTTNAADQAWLFANLDACTRAHVDAIGAVVGHPIPFPAPQPAEDGEVMYVAKPPTDHPKANAALVTNDVVSRYIDDTVELRIMERKYGAAVRIEAQLWDNLYATRQRAPGDTN